MRPLLTLILLFSLVTNSISQRVNNVNATQFGNNIEITYTVNDVNEKDPYTIRVAYTSKNGSSVSMTHLYGDVGDGITGNGNKKIIWDVLREVESFEGEYAFKITLIPSGTQKPMTKIVSNNNGEGRLGKFKVTLESAKSIGSSIIFKLRLINVEDNENFKVHLTRSKIVGPDGTEYLGKSGNQGGKEEYGFMNVVLQKGREKQIELLFDYIPENISFIESLEIMRYAGIISSESVIIRNVSISK